MLAVFAHRSTALSAHLAHVFNIVRFAAGARYAPAQFRVDHGKTRLLFIFHAHFSYGAVLDFGAVPSCSHCTCIVLFLGGMYADHD